MRMYKFFVVLVYTSMPVYATEEIVVPTEARRLATERMREETRNATIEIPTEIAPQVPQNICSARWCCTTIGSAAAGALACTIVAAVTTGIVLVAN